MDTKYVGTHEEQLAHACKLTVLTDWLRVKQGETVDLLTAIHDEFGDHHDAFDLLAVRDVTSQLDQAKMRKLISADVTTAVGLHGTESLLVLTQEWTATKTMSRLCSGLPDNLLVSFTLKTENERVERLPVVVTCMDWRLHRSDDFARLIFDSLGYRDFYLMTVPGVGKELAYTGPRLDQVVSQLNKYREDLGGGDIVVDFVSHTDCGKYGGSGAFVSLQHECFNLRHDLSCAAIYIANRVLGLNISTHVAKLEDDRPVGLL